MQKKKGIFGKTKDIQTMFCLAFSREKDVYYTGTMSGQVYVWKGNQLEEIIPDVHKGSVYTIAAVADGFITGGKDGCIRTWDAGFQPVEKISLKDLLGAKQSVEFMCHEGKKKHTLFY